MAKKKSTVPVWTDKEKILAEKIIAEAKKYDDIFIQKYGAAAKALGYCNYGDLPAGTKSYISTLGGKRSHKGVTKVKAPLLPQKPQGVPSAEEWYKEVAKSKTLQHGLHPKDESHLFEFFQEQNK